MPVGPMGSYSSQEKRIPDELARYLNALRTRVHRYRLYGILPEGRGMLRLRARRGSGRVCVVCGEPILASEPEILIEREADPELLSETPVYRLHHLCHVIWLTESHPKHHSC